MKNISLHWLQGIFETVPKVCIVYMTVYMYLHLLCEYFSNEFFNFLHY